MSSQKQRVLLYGNCQGEWLSHTLRARAEIAERYEIIYLSDYQERPPNHPVNDPGFLVTCDTVIWQTASGCKPPWFVADVPATARQIRYPTLWLKLLWPTYAVDPRNVPEFKFPWGRYPYGDRLVMKLLEQGVTPADVPKRYAETDLNTIVNLDRFTEMSLAELRFNDRQSDIAITPFIENSFRTRKLFGSVNHPTYGILHHIFQGIVGALLDNSLSAEEAPPANAVDTLGDEEIPLHPQIIEHFKLTWVFPGMKWRYHSAFLTPHEYLAAYVAFTPIPLGQPPSLWLARAQEAAAQGSLPNAQRILIEASAHFPTVPEILHFLAVLQIRHGDLREGEKVLRYAIGLHPQVAALHYELGRLMLNQPLADEAIRLFQHTLKLDPGHKDARHQLILAAGRRRPTTPARQS
jgi:tetratricopeptide (TPR) repeat protein